MAGELDVMLPEQRPGRRSRRRVLRRSGKLEVHDEGEDALRLLLLVHQVAAGHAAASAPPFSATARQCGTIKNIVPKHDDPRCTGGVMQIAHVRYSFLRSFSPCSAPAQRRRPPSSGRNGPRPAYLRLLP